MPPHNEQLEDRLQSLEQRAESLVKLVGLLREENTLLKEMIDLEAKRTDNIVEFLGGDTLKMEVTDGNS